MNEKIVNSIENLDSASKQLGSFLEIPITNDRDRAGIIKAFEFTFELVWKTCQKISVEDGLAPGGPKSSLKQAFKLDLIPNSEEQLWLTMLEDRNLMSHTYRKELSVAVVKRIEQDYSLLINRFLERVKTRYSIERARATRDKTQ